MAAFPPPTPSTPPLAPSAGYVIFGGRESIYPLRPVPDSVRSQLAAIHRSTPATSPRKRPRSPAPIPAPHVWAVAHLSPTPDTLAQRLLARIAHLTPVDALPDTGMARLERELHAALSCCVSPPSGP